MAGLVEHPLPRPQEAHNGCLAFGDAHVRDESDSDSSDDVVNEEAKKQPILPSKISDVNYSGVASKLSMQFQRKSRWKSKGFSVASKIGSPTTSEKVNMICSEFPVVSKSVSGIDVSCGAMNPFTGDVPYNSAGVALTSPTRSMLSPTKSIASLNSVDLNPMESRSEYQRRKTRLSLISAISYPTLSAENVSSDGQRRLKTSNVQIPSSNRRRRTRSRSRGVERFSYAKALLRSDYELEKLARKIRSEINESELFELAEAAENAAASGVDNFSGKTSTFGLRPTNAPQGSIGKETVSSPTHSESKTPKEDSSIASPSKFLQTRGPSRIVPEERLIHNREDFEGGNGIGSSMRFSEQTLLEHARAAAAAVVIGTPSTQIQSSIKTQNQIQPGRRSMRVESLRDVNEVIPQWKELHSHLRTHFFREKVPKHSLVFSETVISMRKLDAAPNDADEHNHKSGNNHRRKNSFFGKIASKLLPEFGCERSSQANDSVYNSCDIKSSTIHKVEGNLRDCNPDNGVSNKDSSNEQSAKKLPTPNLLVPATASGDCETPSSPHGRALFSSSGDGDEQQTLLTPRLPNKPECFNVNVSTGSSELPLTPEGAGNALNGIVENVDKSIESPRRIMSGISEVSSPPQSAMCLCQEPSCPASPPSEPIPDHLESNFLAPKSPMTPTTPLNHVAEPRKDSVFSTPAHLRIIKGVHPEILNEKQPRSPTDLFHSNSEQSQDSGYDDEQMVMTPAYVNHTEYEPNSIIADDAFARPALGEPETTLLSMPTIQMSKSENEVQSTTQKLNRRTSRTQWQGSAATPTDTRPKTRSLQGKEARDFIRESPSSLAGSISESSSNDSDDDQYVVSNFMNQADQEVSAETSLQNGVQRETLIDTMLYGEDIDEKKESDSAASSHDQGLHHSTVRITQVNMNLGHTSNDAITTSGYAKKVAIATGVNRESDTTVVTKEVESGKTSEAEAGPNYHVHPKIESEKSDDGDLKGLLRHSSKFQLKPKDLNMYNENKEFLRNYFYCAKADELRRLHRSATNETAREGMNSSDKIGNRLACAEPCNSRDVPCFMFGIETMCSGLMELLPDEVKLKSMRENSRKNFDSGSSRVLNRDRASSISNVQGLCSETDDSQKQEEGTWLGMFQKAASERFNIRLQVDQDGKEMPRHPFTPPCLTRKVAAPNKTI